MTDQNVQIQIDEINRKLDLILEEIFLQKQSRETTEDLISDLSIIGKDVFNTAVVELDKAGVELQSEYLSALGIKLIRNLQSLNNLLDGLESLSDFIQDAAPIARQIGLDTIHKMHELEQKGYFDFVNELASVVDNVVTGFTREDVKALADNVVTILSTIKNLTQPDMLEALNNAMKIYKNLDTSNVPEYSIWRVLRELQSPEMRRAMGFIITFLKSITKDDKNSN